MVDVTVVCLVTVDLKLMGATDLEAGGGGGKLEAAALTQMLWTQLSPQEQSWSVMQPTLMADEGAGAEPARAGTARARIARAALKIISTGLIVGLFFSFKKKRDKRRAV